MKERIITGLIFGVVVLSLLLFYDMGRLILLVLIPLLSVIEYLKITKANVVDIIIFIVIISLISVSIYLARTNLIYILIISCIINILLIINLFNKPPFIKHMRIKSLLACFYISVPFLAAAIMNLHSELSHVLISIMILIWVSDSCAYFVGSRVGKRKLFPSISPKKTWEGFYGAGMCVFIASYIVGSLFKVHTLEFWMIFALIIWILGSLGDLIASQVKRIHKVKDSGSILPGHGGFFDRFDAFIFVLPFILLLVHFIA